MRAIEATDRLTRAAREYAKADETGEWPGDADQLSALLSAACEYAEAAKAVDEATDAAERLEFAEKCENADAYKVRTEDVEALRRLAEEAP